MTFLSIDDIDKTIFEALRLEIVGRGYLPDVATSVNFIQEKAAIKANKGETIDIFGVGAWQTRDLKTVSRFTIDRKDSIKGRFGGGVNVEYAYTEGGVQKIKLFRLPESSKTLVYEIRFSTDNEKFELVAQDIISKALGQNSYVRCLSQRTGTSNLTMNIVLKGEYDATNYFFYERVFSFHVQDVFLESDVTELTKIHYPILQIDIKVNSNNQLNVTHIVEP